MREVIVSMYVSMLLALFLLICAVLPTPAWAAENLAKLYGEASANQWTSGYEPSKAIDGDWETGWLKIGALPSQSNPIWLQVDLKKRYQISEIKLVFSHRPFAEATNIYNLYVSADGTNWTLAGSGTLILSTDPVKYINTVTLTPKQIVQYVKYEALGGTFYGCLYEIEIWGDRTPFPRAPAAINTLLLSD